MTSETPCAHDCFWRVSSTDHHAPHCPNAPKPAEPPACQESTIAVEYRLVGGKVVASEPQSEPPIADGVGVGVGVGIANLFMGHEAETAGKVLARAYLALKAERDALKAEVEEKHTMLLNSAGHVNRLDRENAALKGKAAALELELAASDASRKSSTHNLAVANEENAETIKAERASADKYEAESEQKGADLMAAESVIAEQAEDIEALRTAFGLLSTLAPKVVMAPASPAEVVATAKEIHQSVSKEIEKLKAERVEK